MITYFIIGVTVLVSYLAFQNHELMDKLQFNAAKIIHRKQYYRLVSHAFIHANWSHLLVNMFVLFFFGRGIEQYFGYYFGNTGNRLFFVAVLWWHSGVEYLEFN
jgi:membrane associated rhomboid family serine protease